MSRWMYRNASPLLGLVFLLPIMGCRQGQEGGANRQTASSIEEISIVAGAEPSLEDQHSMLEAKDALFKELSDRLMQAMGDKGPAAAIAVCQKEAQQIAEEVGKSEGVRIGRTGVRLRNVENQPPAWARGFTEAVRDTPVFVRLSNGDAAGLVPIKLQGQCLICHGPEEQIAPVIMDQLAKLYPQDEATGFHEGDLRGWFWIEKPSN